MVAFECGQKQPRMEQLSFPTRFSQSGIALAETKSCCKSKALSKALAFSREEQRMVLGLIAKNFFNTVAGVFSEENQINKLPQFQKAVEQQ